MAKGARTGLPEWVRLLVFGLTLLVVEQVLSGWVAELLVGRVDDRVRENGPWVGMLIFALGLLGLAASDEKLRRVLATEPGARTLDRSKLSNLRAFSLGFGLFVLLFFGALQVIRWLTLEGAPDAAIIAVALLGLVIGLWRMVAGVTRLERRAHGDAAPPGRPWLKALPDLAIDGLVALWSAGGLGAVWLTFSADGNLAFHDPKPGQVIFGAIGAGLFFLLFNLPWRHPQHLLASVRAGGHRPLLRELGGLVGVFLLVFAPHVIRGVHEAPLHRAASAGDLAGLRSLEAEGRDLAEPLAGGLGLLHLAAAHGEVATLEYLLSRPGIDVNLVRANDWRQPLHLAIEKKHAEAALALMEAGADIEARARRDRRPLHLAVEAGLEPVVAALIARGAELDAADRLGNTALHLAASKPGPLYPMLRQAGASEMILNSKGKTPAALREARQER